MKQFFYTIYCWLFALPVLVIITVFTAITTIVFSPIFPNTKFSYFPARCWGRICCFFLLVRVKIIGLENIDSKQSYIFAANHQSLFDIFVVYGWLPNIFKWIMKAGLRRIPFVGWACQAAGHIFIDRSTAISANKSIQKAKQQLKHGVSVVIFPEGTRTHTGKLGNFKRGAFRIAADLELPIVPVTLKGCFERLPRSSVRFTPGEVEMHIHPPIDVKTYLPDKSSELIQHTWDVVNSGL